MVDRILRWYIPGEQSRIEQVGGTYYLDDDYVPVWVHLSLKKPINGARPIKIDITSDGDSIFDEKPALVNGQFDHLWTTISCGILREHSVMKLYRDQIANIYPGEDLTVELGLKLT